MRASTLHLTAKDRNKRFVVGSGARIVVTLSSNRSAGYGWVPAYPDWPNGVVIGRVDLVSQRYVEPADGAPGAEGKEILRFRASGHGDGTLGLLYVRLSNLRTPPARRLWFDLDVR